MTELVLNVVPGPTDLPIYPYNVAISTLTVELGETLLAFGVQRFGQGTDFATYNSMELTSPWTHLSDHGFQMATEKPPVIGNTYFVGLIGFYPSNTLETHKFVEQDGIVTYAGSLPSITLPSFGYAGGAEVRVSYAGPNRYIVWGYAGDDLVLTNLTFDTDTQQYVLGATTTVDWLTALATQPDLPAYGKSFDMRDIAWAGGDNIAIGAYWDHAISDPSGYMGVGTESGRALLILRPSGTSWVIADTAAVSISNMALAGPPDGRYLALEVEDQEQLYVPKPYLDFYNNSSTGRSVLPPGTGPTYFFDTQMEDAFLDCLNADVIFRYNESDGSHFLLDTIGLHYIDGGGTSTLLLAFDLPDSSDYMVLDADCEGTEIIITKYISSPYHYERQTLDGEARNVGQTLAALTGIRNPDDWEIYITDNLDYGNSMDFRIAQVDTTGRITLGPLLDASPPKGLDVNQHGPSMGVDAAGNYHAILGEIDPFGNSDTRTFWDMILLADGQTVQKVNLQHPVDQNWYYADVRVSMRQGWASGDDVVWITVPDAFRDYDAQTSTGVDTDILLLTVTPLQLDYQTGDPRVRFTYRPHH